MFDHRLKISVVDWTDGTFLSTVNDAVRQTFADPVDVDSCRAAELAQANLRTHGYPLAEIEYRRSVDEALAHVAHWTVSRDGGSGRTNA